MQSFQIENETAYIRQIIVRRIAKQWMSSFWLLVRIGPSKNDLPTATEKYAILGINEILYASLIREELKGIKIPSDDDKLLARQSSVA